ncbi:MAG: PAS domain S-box protein, partial [Desulfobacterales bacterium]|nr:PAS domain S-box protein [Desulfobacterales bacterium]
VSALEREIESELKKLISLKAFYAGSDKINRPEFEAYAKTFGCECVQVLEWIPRVVHSEREAFEASVKKEGFPDFQIVQRAGQGAMTRALDRDEYYPVSFVEPYKDNEIAFGFDLASNPVRKEALEHARDTGEMTATGRITLVQEKEGGFGFLVFMPVYEKARPSNTLEERRANIKGFYLGVYRVSGIVESALKYLQAEHVDIYFYDMSAPKGSQFLYCHDSYGPVPDVSVSEERTGSTSRLEISKTIDVADRKWRAAFMVSQHFFAEQRSWWPWTALFAGLLSTAFIALYMRLIIGRVREVERFVGQRTDELRHANQMLENEVRVRKQAEQEIRESEKRYRAIVEDQEELVCRFLPDTTLTFVNDAYCRFFNKKPEELLGRTFLPVISEDDVDMVRRELASLKIDASCSRHENRVTLPDGGICWMSWTDRALFDDQGALVEYQAVGRDITDKKLMEQALQKSHDELERRVEARTDELKSANRQLMREIEDRKCAEDALKASERRLSQIIDFLPDATLAIDAQGIVIAWNRAMAEMTGAGAEQMLGQGNYEYALPFYGNRRPILIDLVFHPDPEIEGKYAALRREGDTLFAEVQLPDLKGKPVWLWGKASPIYDASGNVVGAIESMRDITETKDIEKALRESREGLKNIVEKSVDGIFVVDARGIVRFVNPGGERLFGRSSEQLVGSSFGFPLVSGESTEIGIIRKAGEICIGELRSAWTQWEDRAAWLVMIRDITERKNAEERTKASLHEKETMLKEIHHRVKNNMQVISSLLKLQARAVGDDRLKENYKESENRIRSMALVHEMLYRSENLAQVDFKTYINALVRELYRAYNVGESRIHCQLAVEDVALEIEQAVPCGLIINELVSNCLKHAFPEGKSGVIQVFLHAIDDGAVELSVRDNGVGLPPDFDFAKTQSLGLSLVRMLAQYQLHGTVLLNAVQGVEFKITFKEK